MYIHPFGGFRVRLTGHYPLAVAKLISENDGRYKS